MLPRSLSQIAEIEEAYTEVGEELLGIIRKALVNIRDLS